MNNPLRNPGSARIHFLALRLNEPDLPEILEIFIDSASSVRKKPYFHERRTGKFYPCELRLTGIFNEAGELFLVHRLQAGMKLEELEELLEKAGLKSGGLYQTMLADGTTSNGLIIESYP